ncbi:hypothetical protein FB451DRAFT_1168450 [Mycena latifolia]|nr:hypothetical protein FB451DRAFT_1168450 [Mycena latifolia]
MERVGKEDNHSRPEFSGDSAARIAHGEPVYSTEEDPMGPIRQKTDPEGDVDMGVQCAPCALGLHLPPLPVLGHELNLSDHHSRFQLDCVPIAEIDRMGIAASRDTYIEPRFSTPDPRSRGTSRRAPGVRGEKARDALWTRLTRLTWQIDLRTKRSLNLAGLTCTFSGLSLAAVGKFDGIIPNTDVVVVAVVVGDKLTCALRIPAQVNLLTHAMTTGEIDGKPVSNPLVHGRHSRTMVNAGKKFKYWI